MEYKMVEKKDFSGKKVKVLDATYDPGIPEIVGVGKDLGWRKNLNTREAMMNYLKNGERYFYSEDWYGSEKRK
ncbi:hypothetical protein KA005_75705 [bacterium]|nr:hypothetical protein [bacterium]